MNNTTNQKASQEGVFDKRVAMLLDANCAIVYSKLKACEDEYHNGRTWAVGSVREWSEHLPELKENQIRHALERLEKAGLVVAGNYNESAWNKAKWYSTNPVPETEGE